MVGQETSSLVDLFELFPYSWLWSRRACRLKATVSESSEVVKRIINERELGAWKLSRSESKLHRQVEVGAGQTSGGTPVYGLTLLGIAANNNAKLQASGRLGLLSILVSSSSSKQQFTFLLFFSFETCESQRVSCNRAG